MVLRSDTVATSPGAGGFAAASARFRAAGPANASGEAGRGWSDMARYKAALAQGHQWRGPVPEVAEATAQSAAIATAKAWTANVPMVPEQRGEIVPGMIPAHVAGQHQPVQFAVPGMLHRPWQTVSAIVHGDREVSEAEMMQAGQDIAGLGMTGAVVPKPANSVGIFGGRLAKTADHAALATAEEMAAAGHPREKIWSETGWFQGVDKKWRFEIDDSELKRMVDPRDWIGTRNGVKMAPSLGAAYDKAAGNVAPGAPMRIKRIFEHDPLDRAYPMGMTDTHEHQGITSIPLELIPEGNSVHGQLLLDGANGKPLVAMNEALLPGQARETALHEWQHVVQAHEGFPGGSSSERARQSVMAANNAEIDAISASIRGMEVTHPQEFGWFRKMNAATAMKDWDAAIAAEAELAKTKAGRELQALDWRRSSIAASEPTREQISYFYHRDAGEVEARAVQKRANLSTEGRRSRAPWLDYDVPARDQIVSVDLGTGKIVNGVEARPLSTTPETRARITELAAQGKSHEQIARETGASRSTVTRTVQAVTGPVGKGGPGRGRLLTRRQEALLVAERRAGTNDKTLADKYGVDQTTVGTIARRHARRQAAE